MKNTIYCVSYMMTANDNGHCVSFESEAERENCVRELIKAGAFHFRRRDVKPHIPLTTVERQMYPSERDQHLDGLKTKINELLFTTLPPQTTIAEMEKIAVEFCNKIESAWF